MHIVTIKRLQEASEKYREAAREIGAWIKIVKAARWRNFGELRASFPDADDADGFVVFNIRHNRYRLIAAVHYAKMIDRRLTLGHVYIGSFMTHLDTQSGDVTVIQKRRPRKLEPSEYSLLTLIPVGVQPNAIVVKTFMAGVKK